MTERPLHILLVEDNLGDVYLFRKALSSAGLTVELTVLEDGGAAMAFINGEGKYAGLEVPDLAVVDLSLPKQDGIEVVEAIRNTERFVEMPVVVTSSSSTPPPRLKQEALRVARYLVKPPELDSFLQIGTALKEILLDSEARRTAGEKCIVNPLHGKL